MTRDPYDRLHAELATDDGMPEPAAADLETAPVPPADPPDRAGG
jgi:hypothetical protein